MIYKTRVEKCKSCDSDDRHYFEEEGWKSVWYAHWVTYVCDKCFHIHLGRVECYPSRKEIPELPCSTPWTCHVCNQRHTWHRSYKEVPGCFLSGNRLEKLLQRVAKEKKKKRGTKKERLVNA